MTDDAARQPFSDAARLHRARLHSEAAPALPGGIKSTELKVTRELTGARPESPDDPHYRSPEPIASTAAMRPWPVTAGPSKWEGVAEPLRQAIQAAIADKRWPIYLFGSVGVGKTCAAACIYMGWTGSAMWRECDRIVRDVIECRTSPTGRIVQGSSDVGEQMILRLLAETSLLVLNDVGLRKPSEAGYEISLRIIDSRLNKPLIVTSNLDQNQLYNVFDERIASRLLRGTVIHARGIDRRSENYRFVEATASPPAVTNH